MVSIRWVTNVFATGLAVLCSTSIHSADAAIFTGTTTNAYELKNGAPIPNTNV